MGDDDDIPRASPMVIEKPTVIDKSNKKKKSVSIALPPSTSPDFRRYGSNMYDLYDANLFQAVYSKKLSVLKGLVMQPGKVNSKDGDGTPLLHTAVIVSFPEGLSLLLDCGADPSILDASGRTALHIAVLEGQIDCLDVLLRKHAQINATEGKNQRTALHLAIYSNKLEIARRLIEAGIMVNAEDINGETPLQFACKQQNNEAIKLLLKNGANPNAMDIDGMPCLYYCALQSNKEGLQLLIGAGASIDIQDGLGTTPLLRSCYSGELDCMRTLLELGADTSVVDTEGVGCLHCVVKSKSMAALELLWEHLPEDQRKREPFDARGRTPLFWAVTQGDPASIEIAHKLVKDYGSDVEAKDTTGVSVLMAAALKGSLECVKLCIENGADPNEASNTGMTPLHFACLGGHTECVRYLLENGADPKAEDEEDHNPLYCAASGGHLECVKLLNERMGTSEPMNGNGGSKMADDNISPQPLDKDLPDMTLVGLDMMDEPVPASPRDTPRIDKPPRVQTITSVTAIQQQCTCIIL
eukprot:TRINITY_DN3264_c0_g1_i1.p1 TRINITY_DN3264_c0_g1~~TRINITY_DN3264_c0_g1_i1.p1  ORF type:complete len:527 (-),score=124.71 TRINITY_DN3264_c0_g1_i1:1146-2726(-)